MRTRRLGAVLVALSLQGERSCEGLVASQGGRVRHFINLTNGLEALEELSQVLDPDALGHVSFVRIQSSHCEANAFYSVLENLDHNLLFHLATGARCLVYDFGSRESRWPSLGAESGDPTATKIPRALWWGLEWSRYALARLWKLEPDPPSLRGYSTSRLFDDKLDRLPKPLGKRLKYYRKFHPDRVDLRGVYYVGGTLHDGDDEAYAAMAQAWCSRLPEEDDSALTLPPGFVEYRSGDYLGIGRAARAPSRDSHPS